MNRYLLTGATILTGTSLKRGFVGIEGSMIVGVWKQRPKKFQGQEIDLRGKILMAGGIDAHVHFREPGMTSKGDIGSESAAALLGGITSFIDMPNTTPPTTNLATIDEKLRIAYRTSLAGYGFHIGATNTNIAQIRSYIDAGLGVRFGGIKVFMGSSTGNMLVNRKDSLEEIFKIKGKPILVHSEDEKTIKENLKKAREKYGDDIPFSCHPFIRSREACIKSTAKAIGLALKYGTRLHILHVSTAEEVEMIREAKKSHPGITAETSVNYLWFSDDDYGRLGGKLKCNPAVKTRGDRDALLEALADGTIDTIGSDHAPHLLSEKDHPYLKCPSGLPTIQYSLPVALSLAAADKIPLTRLASAYSERAAEIFGIVGRGFIRKGYFADLVVIDPGKEYVVGPPVSKCGWSPYEGTALKGAVEMVWINGELVVSDGKLCAATRQSPARPLRFHPLR